MHKLSPQTHLPHELRQKLKVEAVHPRVFNQVEARTGAKHTKDIDLLTKIINKIDHVLDMGDLEAGSSAYLHIYKSK